MVVDDDVRAGRVQTAGHCGTESLGAARDEHAAAGQWIGLLHGPKIPETVRGVAPPGRAA
jgi:hypothetical protein